jgi:hypothetical protein
MKRLILIVLLLGPLSGCLVIDDLILDDGYDGCPAGPVVYPTATGEPPRVVGTTVSQTREPELLQR